jgi:gluconolactonase
MKVAAALLLLLALAGAAQDLSKFQVEKIGAGYKFTEGPVWSREGFLLFSDIPNNRIMKYVPGSGVSEFRAESGRANGNVYDEKGRLYTCEGGARRVTRTDKNGKIEVLAEKYQGKRLNSPNDIVVSRSGHVYFTDPAFGQSSEARELDFFGVYHLTPKGELTAFAKPTGRPNGIAISPDGKVLYVANSDDRNVRAYDLGKDGNPANERVVVATMEGVPDGMRIDDKGNLWVTAKSVFVFSPEGKQIAEIPIPETPANCAFGGPDMGTLYVTARTSLYRVKLEGVKGAVQY